MAGKGEKALVTAIARERAAIITARLEALHIELQIAIAEVRALHAQLTGYAAGAGSEDT